MPPRSANIGAVDGTPLRQITSSRYHLFQNNALKREMTAEVSPSSDSYIQSSRSGVSPRNKEVEVGSVATMPSTR
jgi:hypothetical protein